MSEAFKGEIQKVKGAMKRKIFSLSGFIGSDNLS
jgi:hypothetical protein